MSRLDSFIRRVTAQRDCLNRTAELLHGREGVILELGLGNGRTFDHLRELFPDKEIFVFERKVAAHPDCLPDDRHLILGEIRETLPGALTRLGPTVLLVHADVGSGNPEVDRQFAGFLTNVLSPCLLPGAMVLSDQDLRPDHWDEVELPPGTRPRRYFMYRTRAFD